MELYPYKIRAIQQLLLKTRNVVKLTVRELNDWYWSDEAWFHLHGYVKAHNSRVTTENPHELRDCPDLPLHSQKLDAWYAMSRSRTFSSISSKQ